MDASAIAVPSADDPRLAPYRALRGRVGADARGRFIAESEHVVRRLLSSGWAVESVLATRARAERLRPDMPPGVPLYTLPRAELDALLGFRLHRAVIACARRPAHLKRSGVALDWDAWLAPRPRARVVVASGLSDPGNLGSIIRTCRAFAIDRLVVDGRGADPLERRAIRASMGHVFTQPLVIASSLQRELARASAAGLRLIAAVATASGPRARVPWAWAPQSPTALLVGNEGHGLEPELLALADDRVSIPMPGDVDSLGVAVATAILVHAWTQPSPP